MHPWSGRTPFGSGNLREAEVSFKPWSAAFKRDRGVQLARGPWPFPPLGLFWGAVGERRCARCRCEGTGSVGGQERGVVRILALAVRSSGPR